LITAMKNKVIAGAWMLDPVWVQMANDPDFIFLKGQEVGEPLGGATFGPTMLKQNRAAGEAFVRAYARTISTYFNGDYKADPAFLAGAVGLVEGPRQCADRRAVGGLGLGDPRRDRRPHSVRAPGYQGPDLHDGPAGSQGGGPRLLPVGGRSPAVAEGSRGQS